MRDRAQKWAPWLAAVVLVAGIGAFGATRHSRSKAAPVVPHHTAALVASESSIAREFVATAVARKNLARAWQIVAPELKHDMTLDEWKTGTIPVVPYPVAQAHEVLQVASSYTDTALLNVTFRPRFGAKVRPATFSLGLRKVDGSWLVASWAPTSTVTPHKGK